MNATSLPVFDQPAQPAGAHPRSWPARSAPGTVLVTGASTGIGAATAVALATAGWQVVAGVRDLSSAPDAPAPAQSMGGSIHPVRLDVTDPGSITSAMAQVSEILQGGSLTALVNNAGVGELSPMQTVPIEALRAVFEVNVFGAVAVTQAALRLMTTGSRVVFVGSVGDRITMPFGGPLTSSKWAIASAAEAFRLELAADGISVVLIEPGSIHTPAVDKVERAAQATAAQLAAERPALARRFAAAAQRAVANERSGSTPQVVADTIHRALATARPKTRYLTGQHARLLAGLGRLPDPVFDHLRLLLFGQPTRPEPPTRSTVTTGDAAHPSSRVGTPTTRPNSQETR